MNKTLKIILGIIIALVIIWAIVFAIDYNRCANLKMPIFVVSGETADDGGSGIYYGLGYKVNVDKYISAEYGVQLAKVEMYILDYFVIGAIANVHTVVEDEDNNENPPKDIEIGDNYESFVGTVLEETTKYMIVQPNEDEVERKSSDKIVINYGTDHMDYLYGIGRKVVIYYTGYIMETYPAQINTDKISTEGYSDFEISVKKADNTKAKKILNNKDLYKDNSDFNLFYYGLDEVNVTVDGKTMPLEDALRSGKITLDGIIQKANKELEFPKALAYDDGGSIEYHYETYTIIKCHRLDGNRDVWIGVPEMTLNSIVK